MLVTATISGELAQTTDCSIKSITCIGKHVKSCGEKNLRIL